MAETEVVQDAPKGIDAAIAGALDQHYDEPATTAKAGPAVEPDKTEPKIDATGRVHGTDGKFVAKEKSDSAEGKEPVTDGQSAPEAKPAQVTAPDTAPQVQQVALPDGWTADQKARIATLAPELQQLVVDQYKAMQGDYTRKSQELAETRKQHEPLFNELNRWSPYLRQLNLSPHEAFGQMLTVEHQLRTGSPEQKAQALAYLAQYYGVPNSPAGEGEQTPAQPIDPAYQQLRQQFGSLAQTVQQMRDGQAQAERQRAQAEFDAIGLTKDQNGTLKYPHFERVKQAMITLVANGQSETWDQAYSKAVRLDDELYTQELESERKRVKDAEEKARQEAVEKAKKAAPVKTSTSAPAGGTQRKGLDSHLEAAMEKAGLN